MAVLDELTILSILAPALLSGLLGVLLGTFITNWQRKHSEIRQSKLKILQQMMGNSFNLNREGFAEAINQVFVVFYDSKEVLTALKVFHEYSLGNIKSDELNNQKLFELFKAMFKNLNIKTDPLTDNFFLKPFKTPF